MNRGSTLARRRRDRENEIESDERDRQREMEEIEEIRKRLVEQHPDENMEEVGLVSNAPSIHTSVITSINTFVLQLVSSDTHSDPIS